MEIATIISNARRARILTSSQGPSLNSGYGAGFKYLISVTDTGMKCTKQYRILYFKSVGNISLQFRGGGGGGVHL